MYALRGRFVLEPIPLKCFVDFWDYFAVLNYKLIKYPKM